MNTANTSHPLKVMLAGLFSLILMMGIARFSYTPLLPIMMEETILNDASGGWLATINYLGYMCGALLATMMSDLKLKDTLYRIGLLVAIISTIGMALAENYLLWSIMRFIAGISTAAGLLLGSGLILNWMLRNGHRAELGIHFGGVGLGIAVSALASILMVGQFNWMQQWQIFAVIGVFLAIPAWYWLPRPENNQLTSSHKKLLDHPPKKSWMRLLYAAYFCAGIGYVISATFLVTIIDIQPSLQGSGNMVWLVTGLAAAPACYIWDKVARKIGELPALFIAYGLNIIGIIIPVLNNNLTAVIISGFLFGATFIGIVSLMLTMVGKFFPTKPAKPMGKLTISYGIAQITAPALSGMLAESSGNYNTSLILATIFMIIGMALIAFLQTQEKYEQLV